MTINLAGPVPRGAAEWGVDVSWANSLRLADWQWMADNGATFAMIKAYDGGSGEDDRLQEHITNCVRVGMEPGMYWFLRPAKTAPLRVQLNRFVNLVERHQHQMPRLLVAIDIEDGRDRPKWIASDRPLESLRVSAYGLKRALGTRPFLYYNLSFGKTWGLHTQANLMQYPLWAARWSKLPDRSDVTIESVTREFIRRPSILQYGGSGRNVPAPIPKNLDKNVCPLPLERNR